MLIKGSGIRSLLKAVEKKHGEAGLKTMLDRVPEDVRRQLEPAVLPNLMYPVAVSVALQRAIYQTIGTYKWDVSYELGIEAARIDFGGIYRLFLRAVDHDVIWSRIERVFSQYNSQGTARWTERTKTSAVGEVVGVAGYTDGIWYSVAGRCAGMLLLCGAKTAEVKIVNPLPTRCDFRAYWTP